MASPAHRERRFPASPGREADIEHKKNRALLPGVCRQKMNRAINA
jgi:hypothetical protein